MSAKLLLLTAAVAVVCLGVCEAEVCPDYKCFSEGDACSDATGQCVQSNCVSDQPDGDTGHCMKPAVGSKCNPGEYGDDCNSPFEALYCDPASKTCQASAMPGDPCTKDADCAETGLKKCTNGKCEGIADGQACPCKYSADYNCNPGSYCKCSESGVGGVCTKQIDAGMACTQGQDKWATDYQCVPGYECNGAVSKCVARGSLGLGEKSTNLLVCKSLYTFNGICSIPPVLLHPNAPCNATQYPATTCAMDHPRVYGLCMCSNKPTGNSDVCTDLSPSITLTPAIMAAQVVVSSCGHKWGCHVPELPKRNSCVSFHCNKELNQLHCAYNSWLRESASKGASDPWFMFRCVDASKPFFPCNS